MGHPQGGYCLGGWRVEGSGSTTGGAEREGRVVWAPGPALSPSPAISRRAAVGVIVSSRPSRAPVTGLARRRQLDRPAFGAQLGGERALCNGCGAPTQSAPDLAYLPA